MGQDLWRFDPAIFPRRLDLVLSDHALDQLERLSLSSGRSMRDLAADLLCQAISDPRPHR